MVNLSNTGDNDEDLRYCANSDELGALFCVSIHLKIGPFVRTYKKGRETENRDRRKAAIICLSLSSSAPAPFPGPAFKAMALFLAFLMRIIAIVPDQWAPGTWHPGRMPTDDGW